MFSHTINNPKNFVITKDYIVIPFGYRCATALACKYANLRKISLPFDWGIPFFPSTIQKILTNNFNGFTDFKYSDNKFIRNNVYGFGSDHYSKTHSINVETFNRRIERFKQIMTERKKIYFVYINENYLYDTNYRQDKFVNDKFNEMLELEKFIKNKYTNIDYNILYFDFKHHNIPASSNIINIVLKSNKLYDNEWSSPFEKLRNYCGEILVKLFNTKLTLGYNNNDFKG